jgi:hypothetical protein
MTAINVKRGHWCTVGLNPEHLAVEWFRRSERASQARCTRSARSLDSLSERIYRDRVWFIRMLRLGEGCGCDVSRNVH